MNTRYESLRPNPRSGMGLLETIIAVSILTVVMLASLAMVESGRRFSNSTLEITTVEDLSQQMLYKIERELAKATGAELDAALTSPFASGSTGSLEVTSTVGFPPQGLLVVNRGTAQEERISYGRLNADRTTFELLVRGDQCTAASEHADGTELLWGGLAEPIDDQDNPPAFAYDGIAQGDTGPVFFRGDGTGFSFRIPVDPTGGTNVLNGDDLFWGAEVPGVGPTVNGRQAIYFAPKGFYDEAETSDDINGDGDFVDVFDIGQLRLTRWDTTDPTRVDDYGMGPTAILQERCNWGGDLDSDGFDDPLFLWDENTNLLHLRLFLIGTTQKEQPVVREVESVMFLRNEPEL